MKKITLSEAVAVNREPVSRKSRRMVYLTPVLALALHAPVFAVDENESKGREREKKSLLDLEEVVVTGTPGGAGTRKLDASFAISTINAEDIQQFSPTSTADLFKTVPGVWVESSSGVAGPNIFVRGFPGGGDAPFVTVQLRGSPVYPPSTLSFLDNSSIFRIDETVARMEALRGGPNPVFSNGQPGLTTNFRLKEGGPETQGVLKYTTSDYDLSRTDAMISGEIADRFYYMIGGYVRSSPGVRDAGFNAEEGRQFTVNLTRELDNGNINVYTRITDDHGVWYLPAPLNVPGVENDFTYVGTRNRNTTIAFGPNGETRAFDFGEGRGWDGAISGGSVEIDLGDGWRFTDRFNVTEGDADTLGLVPEGAATRLGDLGHDSATTLVSGRTLDAGDFVQRVGFWVVRKAIDSFTNDFSLSKSWDGARVTAGYYTSRFSADDWWALGNNTRYMEVESGGELTDVELDENVDDYDINANGDGRANAFYLAGEWDLNYQLRLDAGARFENHEIESSVDEGMDGTVDKIVEYDESETSWTLGLNYALSDKMGVFARINDGSKLPYFDDFRDNYDAYRDGDKLIQDITQYEAGYKFSSAYFAVFATGFFNEVEGDTFVRQPGAPADVYTTEAYGVEIDASMSTDFGFALSLNATVQETEITQSPDDEGNESRRQPGWQLRLTPSYGFDLSRNIKGRVYATLTAVDDRFEDNANTVELDGYEKLDLGVTLSFNERFTLWLSAHNVTDDEGLTEGDPRSDTSSNARTILPRSVELSVGYHF